MISYTVEAMEREPDGYYPFSIYKNGVKVADYRFNHRTEADEIRVDADWIACFALLQGGGPEPWHLTPEGVALLDSLTNKEMAAKPNYAAMTVNERLYTAGLLDAFDRAARSRNRARMIEILADVDVGSPDKTADAIIADPRKYGY